MPDRDSLRRSLARTLRQFSSLFPGNDDPTGETRLYYRRACLAAAEERYDVALIFCAKALELDSRHLPTRLLVAQIHDHGLKNFDSALKAYRKVIALAGYDSSNPYCAGARAALSELVQSQTPEAAPALLPQTES